MADKYSRESTELRGPVTAGEPVIRPIPLPNGARIAFTIQVALEAWAGTNASAGPLGSRMPEEAIRRGVPDYAALSAQQYGPRTGMARLTRTIEDFGFHACIHISALVAERWPELIAGLARDGHEIVGHGYSQDEPMAGLEEGPDLAVVRKCAEIIYNVTGQRPAGWSSHGSRRGQYTVLSLLKEGYIYTRDFRDADIPYVVAQLGERRLLSMPRTDEINDLPVMNRHGNPPSVYVEYFKRAFDQLYAEGEKEPKVMTCVAHAYVMGKPWGASAFAECLKHVRSHDKVWSATGREVAEYYLQRLPAIE